MPEVRSSMRDEIGTLREYETVFLVKPDLTDDNVDKVKERILEFLAVRRLVKDPKDYRAGVELSIYYARHGQGPKAVKIAEALVHAKDAWNKYASGNPPSLIAFRSACAALKERTAGLGEAHVATLAREVAVLATWLSATRKVPAGIAAVSGGMV